MKTIRILMLYALSLVAAYAGQRDVVTADVIGLWRGLSVGHTPGEERERDLWIIERRPDGTFRTKKYRIDSYKKVFFVVTPLVEGTWTLKDSVLSHRIAGTDSAVSEKVTRFDDGHLTWSHEGEGISDKDERWCHEHPLDKFRELFGPESQFGKDYRQVPKEEFEKRYKSTTGEQAAPSNGG
jgi:hypothetical protein